MRRKTKIAHGEIKSKRFEDKLLGLHKHAQQLASAIGMDEIVAHTLDAMEFTLGFSFAGFSVVEGRWLCVKGKRGRLSPVTKLSLDGPGISVKAINSNRTLRIPDTRQEPAYVDSEGRSGKDAVHSTLSELAVPILVDGVAVGDLNVENASVDAFTESDARLLETLALHVASAFGRLQNLALLRKGEERYRFMFENMANAVAVYEANNGGDDFVFKEFNNAAEKIEGKTREQVIGKSVLSTFPGVKDFGLFEVFQRVWKTGRPEHHPTSMYKDDRIASWRENYVYKLPSGEIVAIYADVTQRMRMENELRRYSEHLEELVKARTSDLAKSEEKYHRLADNMSDVMFTIDLEGNYTYVTPSAEELTRYAPAKLMSMNMKQLIAPEDYLRILERLKARVQGEKSLPAVEFEIIRADGHRTPVELHTSPILSDQGELVGIQGIARDITARKDMEDELRRYSSHLEERTRKLAESEARFKELADLLPQFVFEIDEKGNFTFVNRSGLALAGYSESDRTELRGRLSAFQLLRADDRKRAMERMRRVMNGEKLGPTEYTLMRKDGSTLPVMLHASPIIRDGRPAGLRGIVVDISERKEMEQRLLRAERLAAIGETATMVAHDLRNPLQGIAGAAYVLKNEPLLADERNEMLDVIEHGVEYSDAIVRDLLDYAATVQLVVREVTPKAITTSALVAVKIPENIKLEDQSQEKPVISADPDKLKRVFVNLLENAIEAMPDGGTLTISSRDFDGHVDIAFSDTGTGIPSDIMVNLWKPLQTTKAKGLGLGLAICRRLVDAHGGDISVETKVGEGTKFTVRLPCTPRVVNHE